MSEPVEQELEAIREEARRLDDAITRNEISIGEGGPILLGHLRRIIEIDLEQLQVLVPMREWAVRCCIDDWAHDISPLNAWDDFIAGLDQFVREFASRATNISVAVWFRQFYDARPIDWDILLELAQVAATVTSVSREGANADYWVLEGRHWDAWTVREAADVTEHNHNTIEYCLRQNGELFKRVASWEEVDQHDGRGYLRYSEAELSETPMSESDVVLMDFEPEKYHSEDNGITVDTDRDTSENLLYSSKGAGLANRLFQSAARGKDSAMRGTDEEVPTKTGPADSSVDGLPMGESVEQEFSRVQRETKQLSDALTSNEVPLAEGCPALLAQFRRMLELAPENVKYLAETKAWAVNCSLLDWAAHVPENEAWVEFIAGLDQLVEEFSAVEEPDEADLSPAQRFELLLHGGLEHISPGNWGTIAPGSSSWSGNGTIFVYNEEVAGARVGLLRGLSLTPELVSLVGEINNTLIGGSFWLVAGQGEGNWQLIWGHKMPWAYFQSNEFMAAYIGQMARIAPTMRENYEERFRSKFGGTPWWSDDVDPETLGLTLMIVSA